MQTVIRVLIVYVFVLVAMRVIGKREFGQLSPHEFVTLMLIPEMVSVALNQEDRSLTNGLLGVSTILVVVVLTSILSHRFKAVHQVVAGPEAVLVHNGKIYEDVLNKERVTPEEILTEARRSGVESIEKIKWALLEAEGQISIIPMKDDAGNDRPPQHRHEA